MSHNIEYQAYGHFIYIGHQSQFNTITKNLVSDTKDIIGDTISGETVNNPCIFLAYMDPAISLITSLTLTSDRKEVRYIFAVLGICICLFANCIEK